VATDRKIAQLFILSLVTGFQIIFQRTIEQCFSDKCGKFMWPLAADPDKSTHWTRTDFLN